MKLPLFFSFAQPVFGNGFLAGVRMNGRALLEEEEGEETWISGVAPVGIGGGGADRGAAFTAFRSAWVAVLFDIAAESGSFGVFEHACKEFLGATTPLFTEEWSAALDEVRRTRYVDPTLRRELADQQEVTFEVVDLTANRYNPAENELEKGLQEAA